MVRQVFGQIADRAQEVLFPVPASRVSNNSAGVSERSACQPRQRVAKGDAASIGCSIPLNQADGLKRSGGNSSGHNVYGVGCEALDKPVMNSNGERINEIPDERRFCFGTDGIIRFSRIIACGQVGKGRRSAGHRRVKGLGPEVALRAVYADRRNPGDGLAEIKGVGAFKG